MTVNVEIHHTNPETGRTEIYTFVHVVINLQEAITVTERRLKEKGYSNDARYYIIDVSGELIYSNIFL